MKTIQTKWTGIRPLVMHNAAMVDKLNPAVRRINEINLKPAKKRTDSDIEEIQRLEWEASLYWDGSLGLCIPADNIEKCIREGAQKSRLGKSAEAASFVTEPLIKLECGQYPMSLDRLYEQQQFQFRMPVRLPPRTGPRVMKTRPIIPTSWSLTFSLEFDDSVLNKKDLVKAMVDAGSLVGLGDWRPKFGRFIVE